MGEKVKQKKGKGLHAFVGLIDLLAVIILVVLWPYHVEEHWIGMFLLSTLVALAGATPVRIPALRTSVSASDPFVFTALAAYGPMPACVVAGMGVLGSALGKSRPGRPVHLVFNLGNVIFSTGLAAVAYLLVGGKAGGPIQDQVWPLVLACTVYFTVNTVMVTTAIVIDTNKKFLSTWTMSGLWTAVSTYAGLTVSVGLLFILELAGPSGLALGIPPCWLLVAFYRTHKERQEEQQSRIHQIEVLNLELEDKVKDRTVELQGALSRIEETNKTLMTTNERLSEANRAKSEFLANVSHELRTPLNAVIGFSDLLVDPNFGELNDEQVGFARDIHDSGEHLLRLINDILDLSKVEAGKMEVHAEIFDLPKAVRDVVSMLRAQATSKEIELVVDCADEVHDANMDGGMFRQVLVNLVSNAVKFTPEGGTVTSRAEREGGDLSVDVEDTGIGIAEDDLARIFEEFYQVDGSYARNYGGTGLGLALARRMVEMQDGDITVTSTPGKGSRFSCFFPGKLVDSLPQEEESRTEEIGVFSPATTGRTIIVVEDNPLNRKLARNVLRSRGFKVFEATSGEEALALVKKQRADLILMDLQLPGMDGLEVTRRLKANPATAEIPIVALTAHAQDGDEERAREAGCAGYITKPIRLAQFPTQVEAYLVEDRQHV